MCVSMCICVNYDCWAHHTLSLSSTLDCKVSLLSPKCPTLHHHRKSLFAASAQTTILGPPHSSFLPPGSFKWHCWKPPRGRCTRGNTHHCQLVTTQRKANMSVYATRTTTRKTQARSADRGWACAPLRGAGGTCPFKIYFSQLVGAELSGLAWAELHCAVHVW